MLPEYPKTTSAAFDASVLVHRLGITMKTFFFVLCLSVFTFAQKDSPQASPANRAHIDESRLAGLERNDGLFLITGTPRKALFELSRQRLEQEFIYFTGLSSGIGSIEMFANSFTAWQALAGPAPQRDPIFQLP
jgi:hypothetical protein